MDYSTFISNLKNRYFIIRHGKSEANVAGKIVSDPAEGVPGYGLVQEGRKQVEDSVRRSQADGLLDSSTVIVSSDFLRAHDTAKIAKDILGTGDIGLSANLHERHFGGWDKTHNGNYEKVWKDDAKDANHTVNGVEPVSGVLKRAMDVVRELEERYSGKDILLVSHGDTLQIMQTAFEGRPPEEHRQVKHLETAEIRRLGPASRS